MSAKPHAKVAKTIGHREAPWTHPPGASALPPMEAYYIGEPPTADDVDSLLGNYEAAQKQVNRLTASLTQVRRVMFGDLGDEDIASMLEGMGIYLEEDY